MRLPPRALIGKGMCTALPRSAMTGNLRKLCVLHSLQSALADLVEALLYAVELG